MTTAADDLGHVLGSRPARLGFFPLAAEVPVETSGVAFLRIGVSGSSKLLLTAEPQEYGASVRLFLWSSYGDWLAQDLERWGVPGNLRYRHPRSLPRQCRPLLEALEHGVLARLDTGSMA